MLDQQSIYALRRRIVVLPPDPTYVPQEPEKNGEGSENENPDRNPGKEIPHLCHPSALVDRTRRDQPRVSKGSAPRDHQVDRRRNVMEAPISGNPRGSATAPAGDGHEGSSRGSPPCYLISSPELHPCRKST